MDSLYYKTTLGERIALIRKLNQENRDVFASMMGVSKNTLVFYEKDERVPGADFLNNILGLCRVINPTWLLTGEGSMKRGQGVEVDAEPKGTVYTNIADRSPVKKAAVSYIDAMTDIEATKVISFIVSLQNDSPKFTADGMRITDDIRRLMNMSPEGKRELRAILEARIKTLEDESVGDPIELRPTGT